MNQISDTNIMEKTYCSDRVSKNILNFRYLSLYCTFTSIASLNFRNTNEIAGVFTEYRTANSFIKLIEGG